MANCPGIFEGADFDCVNPLQAGVNERLILFNFDDIASVSYNGTIVTDITLKAGKLAYAFEGTRNSLVPQYNYSPETFSVGYVHQCQFQVFDISQSQKDNTESFANKKVVAIVENLDKQTDSAYEIYGLQAGMDTSEDSRIPGDSATAGSMTIVLATNEDGAKESKKPRSIFDTDLATTKAKIDGLLNLPSILNLSNLALSTSGGDSEVITGDNYFLSGNDDVTSVDWIDSLGAITNEPGYVTNSNTQITIASTVSLSAGTYKVRVTTSAGSSSSRELVIVS